MLSTDCPPTTRVPSIAGPLEPEPVQQGQGAFVARIDVGGDRVDGMGGEHVRDDGAQCLGGQALAPVVGVQVVADLRQSIAARAPLRWNDSRGLILHD